QAEDGIRDFHVTGVQTCALPIWTWTALGAAPNAVQVLCELIAACKGSDGKIRIPGFYDRVVEPTPQERAAYAALPFDEQQLMKKIGRASCRERVYSTQDREARTQ